MRTFVVLGLTLLTACELQPAPKIQQKDRAAGSAAGSAAVAAPATPSLPTPSQPAPPDESANPNDPNDLGATIPPSPMKRPFEITASCNEVGVKVAATLIAEARDEAQKQMLGTEQSRIVRRTAETCTRDKWSDAQIKCFIKADSAAAMQECGKDLAAPKDE